MKVVLISPKGMLGRAVAELLTSRGIAFLAVSRPEFDLCDTASVRALDLEGITAVINCAAFTDVDGAETDEERATLVNGRGVGLLADHCAAAGAVLVHFSTDYVFAGDACEPYPVDGELVPLNAYGRSKARGEQLIRAAGPNHLILRTSWLYAPWGNNFVLTMARLGRQREQLKVVDDQRGRPTSAQHLAQATLRLLEHDARGTLHVTDGDTCTWFEFATAIVAAVNPDCAVQPCSSDAFVRPAKRPAYSVLDLGPTEALIGAMPSWRENLARVLAQR